MEHTIHSLSLAFINEQINYHAIHGVWEDDVDGMGMMAVVLFLQRTVDENTATNLVEEANDPDAESMFDEVYEKLAFLVSCEDDMGEQDYKNQH